MSESDAARDTLGHLRYIKVPVVDYMSLAQRAKTKRHSEEPKEMRWWRNGFWGASAAFCSAGLVLTAGRIEGWFAPDTSIIVWSIALTLLSSVFAVVVQMTINKRVMIAEIRDARPVDNIALGEMTAQIEANRELIRQLLEKAGENEQQRRADFDMIRENSRKALEGIHLDVERLQVHFVEQLKAAGVAFGQHLERQRASIMDELPTVLEDAARKGYAAGYTDALVQGGGGRSLRPVRDDR